MFWITNVTLILPERVVPGALLIKEGRIAAVADQPGGEDLANLPVIDGKGQYLLPGLIDMHSDAIEKEATPRPGTVWPAEYALAELDKKLAGHGITTIFHSFSLSGGLDIRSDASVVEMIRAVRSFDRSLVRNWVHLRYEIANAAGLSYAEQLLREGSVDLFSVMDHTPGQGQYTDPKQYLKYASKTYGTPEAEVEKEIEHRRALRAALDEGPVWALVKVAQSLGIGVASHDDDSAAKVALNGAHGISLSEFPITREAAIAAQNAGMHVVVGAPNVLRGGSHNNNLSAAEAIAAGWADMLCSDYYPAAILGAIFRLHTEGVLGLPAAVRLGTLNVAEAVGMDAEWGSLAPGKRADLILVDWAPGRTPLVTTTWVDGRQVYQVNYNRIAVEVG